MVLEQSSHGRMSVWPGAQEHSLTSDPSMSPASRHPPAQCPWEHLLQEEREERLHERRGE